MQKRSISILASALLIAGLFWFSASAAPTPKCDAVEGDYIVTLKDIAWFLKTRGLPNTTDAVYAQIIGGYSKTNEQQTVAIDRALRFSQLLDQAHIPALANVATTLSSSSTLAPGRIAIKFSFAEQITVDTGKK